MPVNVLKLHFKAVEYNGWPSIRIMFDGDIYEELTITQSEQFVEIPLNLVDGKHLLEIERYGKTDNNVLFVDGQILQDQLVELVDMYIDDIKLNDLYKYKDAVFTHKDGSIPNGYVWGFNGTFSWPFEVPVIDWLIHLKQTIENDNVALYIPGKQDNTRLYNLLNQFRNIINESPI